MNIGLQLTRTVYLIGLSRFLQQGLLRSQLTKTASGLSPRCLFSFLSSIRKMLFFIHLERFLPQQAAPRVRQKPRHTLLGRALEKFQTGQSARGCAALRRLSPTKHTAGPLYANAGRVPLRRDEFDTLFITQMGQSPI
jgi:hypothetical protein